MIHIPLITQPSRLHVIRYIQFINTTQQTPKIDNQQTQNRRRRQHTYPRTIEVYFIEVPSVFTQRRPIIQFTPIFLIQAIFSILAKSNTTYKFQTCNKSYRLGSDFHCRGCSRIELCSTFLDSDESNKLE